MQLIRFSGVSIFGIKPNGINGKALDVQAAVTHIGLRIPWSGYR
jgi:hypothetical protein